MPNGLKDKALDLRKGLIVFLLTVFVLVGGTTVGAVANESPFQNKVKEFTYAVLNSLLPQLELHIEGLSAYYSNQITHLVANSFTTIKITLDQYAEQEKIRADEEIKAYYNEKIAEINKNTDAEIIKGKEKITKDTNQYIQNEKKKIDQEFDEALKKKEEMSNSEQTKEEEKSKNQTGN